VERGVRFVQLYLNNWDHHGNLTGRLPMQTKDVDQATYGLIQDLKSRGMFDETLILWG
ncbi:MAG TPA: sulfatase, partial [Verrucomicrobiales bacterium]|nr:sulfatase [Verrucomicrobiales bacterium]